MASEEPTTHHERDYPLSPRFVTRRQARSCAPVSTAAGCRPTAACWCCARSRNGSVLPRAFLPPCHGLQAPFGGCDGLNRAWCAPYRPGPRPPVADGSGARPPGLEAHVRYLLLTASWFNSPAVALPTRSTISLAGHLFYGTSTANKDESLPDASGQGSWDGRCGSTRQPSAIASVSA